MRSAPARRKREGEGPKRPRLSRLKVSQLLFPFLSLPALSSPPLSLSRPSPLLSLCRGEREVPIEAPPPRLRLRPSDRNVRPGSSRPLHWWRFFSRLSFAFSLPLCVVLTRPVLPGFRGRTFAMLSKFEAKSSRVKGKMETREGERSGDKGRRPRKNFFSLFSLYLSTCSVLPAARFTLFPNGRRDASPSPSPLSLVRRTKSAPLRFSVLQGLALALALLSFPFLSFQTPLGRWPVECPTALCCCIVGTAFQLPMNGAPSASPFFFSLSLSLSPLPRLRCCSLSFPSSFPFRLPRQPAASPPRCHPPFAYSLMNAPNSTPPQR